MDGEMAGITELRPRGPDSEKITINLGYVDLGHVDLMVREGFYSNRTDFIRTAIRNQLGQHAGFRQARRRAPHARSRPAQLFARRS
jgi:Arc/MetJ-type ribon-helix-helix transcriptional regulator